MTRLRPCRRVRRVEQRQYAEPANNVSTRNLTVPLAVDRQQGHPIHLATDPRTCLTPGEPSHRLPGRSQLSDYGRIMDDGPGRKTKLLLERCESGRIGLTANELTWVTGSEGSNPSLSARKVGHRPASGNSARPGGSAVLRRSGGKRIGARSVLEVVGLYWLQTLGCPKNQVDSDKLEGYLAAEGFDRADDPAKADLVVVNTCAFIEAARQESIDTVLELADRRRAGSRLVVTGCLAERYGDQLLDALPEVDLVAGFGQALTTAPPPPAPVAVALAAAPARVRPPTRHEPVNAFDLLELPRPAARAPWAYVKVAEGCDRICGFCAIPSFRGKQRSRPAADILAEVDTLSGATSTPDAGGPPLREVVLVAQDLASYGRDRSGPDRHARIAGGPSPIAALTRAVAAKVVRTRLLYLYPSGLTDELIEAVLGTGVPYFDLSLQHVSRPLLANMRRWGDGERFLRRMADIRDAEPAATFRSSFILGYPGETERDHDLLLQFLEAAQLDWAGFFTFSNEEGTHAAGLPDQVPAELALERLRECSEVQDAITAAKRDALIGSTRQVLVDAPGRGRTVHEAPEIDGIVHVPRALVPGAMLDMVITAAEGPDLHARPADGPATDRALAATGAQP
jgi:ribosomal protein S12 methylthiotransferase